MYTTPSAVLDAWIGNIGAGKQVIDVVMMEPVTPGSNQLLETSRTTPVLAADLRLGPTYNEHTGLLSSRLSMSEVETLAHNTDKLFELSSESKQAILSELLIDGAYVDERVNELQHTQDSSAWTCAHCTYINVTARVRCGACSKARRA